MGFTVEHDGAPKELWGVFSKMTEIPRPSKKEEKIRDYIIGLAKAKGLNYRSDKAGNIAISVPPSKGKENSPKIIIQNHIDMVVDAIPGKVIDFEKDPIEAYVDGDWVKAKGTTLGADNGIGCAAALALLSENSLVHPELNLLFTVDEETGLTGAMELDPGLVSGDFILNLDTEEWGSLYVGCAGGADFEFRKNYELESIPEGYQAYEVSLKSFSGGHSGLDIHRYRVNAAKYLTSLLGEVNKACGIRLVNFHSGRAHNIIPRDASACFVVDEQKISKVTKLIDNITERWKSFICEVDQGYEILFEEADEKESLSRESSDNLLYFLSFFPHGVDTLVRDFSGEEPLVGVSNNMAVTTFDKGHFYLLTSLRFFDRQEAYDLENRFHFLSKHFGMDIKKNSEYPSWKPDFGTDLLGKAKAVYEELYGEKPKVKAIHAGLECGILIDRLQSGIQAISFGPTIVNAHSPDERVYVPSVSEFWKYFTKLLESL